MKRAISDHNIESHLPEYLRLFPNYAKYISSIQEIANFLKQLPEGALIVWDYDYTIRRPASNVISRQNRQERELFYYMLEHESPELDLKSTVKKQNYNQLVEAGIDTLIQDLTSQGKKMIGCTMQSANSKEKVTKQLAQFQIDFNKTAPYSGDIIFDPLRFANLKRDGKVPAEFYKGTLFCGARPKGRVIEAFLKQSGFNPRAVVLIDDKAKNFKSLKLFGERTKTIVYGFMYHITRINNPINTRLLAFQYDELLRNQQWLPDEQARTKRARLLESESTDEKISPVEPGFKD